MNIERTESRIQRIIREAVDRALDQLRRKLKKLDAVDVVGRVLEDIIPKEISGDERSRLKAQIKKRLRKEEVIK